MAAPIETECIVLDHVSPDTFTRHVEHLAALEDTVSKMHEALKEYSQITTTQQLLLKDVAENMQTFVVEHYHMARQFTLLKNRVDEIAQILEEEFAEPEDVLE